MNTGEAEKAAAVRVDEAEDGALSDGTVRQQVRHRARLNADQTRRVRWLWRYSAEFAVTTPSPTSSYPSCWAPPTWTGVTPASPLP